MSDNTFSKNTSFKKVLIANRGAIACRIIRTLKKLSIQSVAVYAESDANSLHVSQANESFCLGEGGAAQTYLDAKKIIDIAKQCGAEAIHPGYGFLSENPDFVSLCEANDIAFVGPTSEQMQEFGLKHRAREIAAAAEVPLLPGTDLLNDLDAATNAAESIGYPVMLKSTAGGGGIGMQLCYTQGEIEQAFDSVKRLSANNFANDGVFIEKYIARARHIEVQIFGDGKGEALAIGERDCSSQRRNQKVVEECPAPNLSEAIKAELHQTAENLLSSVSYRNAGTVEFILDADTNEFYFLEVNTRLQVEHGVTEEVYGVDLVEWMLACAADQAMQLDTHRGELKASGHAIQVRVYAEDPYKDFQPSPGVLSHVFFPDKEGLRIDHWVESGIEIPPYFDPMIAKVIVHSKDRDSALSKLSAALNETTLYGSETNLTYLIALLQDKAMCEARVTTRYLNDFVFRPSRIDVLQAGTQTTIQDYPARTGYWDVGVPPSGPFDNYAFRLANRLLENESNAAGLEITVQGPTLRFSCATQIVIAGATSEAEVDGQPVPLYKVVSVEAGQTLSLGRVQYSGARTYLCVRGGIQCPEYLGSRSTFTLGQLGGHNGRALRVGDVLHLDGSKHFAPINELPDSLTPEISNHWDLRVMYGPHGAPDFFTNQDIDNFFEHEWEVHYNSSRTGIRLIGPKPEWARKDGGEAGLHPSNIHDNAYAFGTVDFTGDMPVILGPDGPSLGGFVCPATVIQADLWKLGQLRSGDKIRFFPVNRETAIQLEKDQSDLIERLEQPATKVIHYEKVFPVIASLDKSNFGADVVYRAAGDRFLLVEYGEQELDIEIRLRAHALMLWLQKNPLRGMQELTPGIRSLQIHFDSQQLSVESLLTHLGKAEQELYQNLDELKVPSRTVYLPLSWDDTACRLAIEKYQQSVRVNAPWCPSNLEFIRRINGLDSIEAVKDIVFSAAYLVMGLGDVYLGAPVATPVDPRHRLVTTKYNPARTWTAENSVGIGGSYLCVYGMEGPGGYQFVGRTLQMWNKNKATEYFEKPWLLRFFDQIRFYPVSHDELEKIRKDFPQGRYPLRIEEGEFSYRDYKQMLQENDASIQAFKAQREAAFAAELEDWHAKGQFHFEVTEQDEPQAEFELPENAIAIDSSVSGSVWKIEVEEGQVVEQGECLMILESMKMEIPVVAVQTGTVTQLLLKEGQRVSAGQALLLME